MKNKLLTIVAAGLMVLPLAASAGVINGDFETGDLSGWTSTDNVTSQGGTVISGSFSALLNAGGGGLNIADLDTFFGLSAGTLAAANLCSPETCINGQGMIQSITVSAGETLSFDWNALALESFYSDSAFFVPGDGGVVLLANGRTGPVGVLGNYSHTFAVDGTYSFGFGVVNGLDSCCGSTLLIDNVASDSAVPAPATLALFGLGLAGLGWSRRKKA